MSQLKSIQIIRDYMGQHGTTDDLEALVVGIEKQNRLFLDLVPTDLMKALMPVSTDLKWIRKANLSKHRPGRV